MQRDLERTVMNRSRHKGVPNSWETNNKTKAVYREIIEIFYLGGMKKILKTYPQRCWTHREMFLCRDFLEMETFEDEHKEQDFENNFDWLDDVEDDEEHKRKGRTIQERTTQIDRKRRLRATGLFNHYFSWTYMYQQDVFRQKELLIGEEHQRY